MDLFDFIVYRNTEKFVDDTRSDLWKYRRFLEKRDDKESKSLLATINKKLGIKPMTEIGPEVAGEKQEISKEEKFIREKVKDAVKEHFEE